jgi:hypothetical protein
MMQRILPKLLLWIGLSAMLFSSCVDDSHLALAPAVPNQSFVEEFDTLINAYNRGWRYLNRSEPIGPSNWIQGGGGFPAFSSKGTMEGYVSVDYQATSAAMGIISAWISSPSITMQNGDKIIFYTRTAVVGTGAMATDYANRMQVRLNTNNDGLNVGRGLDVGDFNTNLLDINPTYIENIPANLDPNAYPANWTRYELNVYGLNGPTRGRFAFRYFVEDAGSNGRANLVFISSLF